MPRKMRSGCKELLIIRNKSGSYRSVGEAAIRPSQAESLAMCEVERYQLDIVGLTATHSLGSGAQLLEMGLTLSPTLKFPRGEASSGCGATHKPLAECHGIGVLLEFSSVNERVASL